MTERIRFRKALGNLKGAGSYLGVVVLAAGSLTPAIAQTADDDLTMETIEVLDTRRGTDYSADTASVAGFGDAAIKEIPQSVQVITRDLIDDQGALSLGELFNGVAGASPALSRSTPFGTASTQLRGQDAAIFRDGLRDVDFSDIDASALNNVERVEILKGPAGILYGTGGPGGVVNIVTKRPLDEAYARVTGTLGGRNTSILALDLSQPLGSGFGVRVTGEIERSDSFIDFSENERDNYSAVLEYDDGGRFTATAIYESVSNRDDNAMTRVGLPALGTIIPIPGLSIDPATYLGEPGFDFTDSAGTMATLKLGYRINDAVSLEFAGRRTTVQFDQAEVRTLSPLDLSTLTVARSRARELILDEEQYLARGLVRVQGDLGSMSHDLTVGYEFDQFDLTVTNLGVPNSAVPRISVINPQYLANPYSVPLSPFSFGSLDESSEIFIHDVVRYGPATVTAGIRHIMADFDDGVHTKRA